MPYKKMFKDLQVGDIINVDSQYNVVVSQEPIFQSNKLATIYVYKENESEEDIYQVTLEPYQLVNVSKYFYSNKKLKYKGDSL